MSSYIPSDESVVQPEQYLGPNRIDIFAPSDSTRARVHVIADRRLLQPSPQIGLSRSAFQSLGLPEGAHVRIRHTPSPQSINALRSKIGGHELSEAQYHMLIRDIVEDRYADREVAAFLTSATRSLSDMEVLALTRVRLAFARRLTWDEPIVVDKHSMGGIPGSRITMIVVPIIAAHGLAIPKTSSRAITSAAGTADVMEVAAQVDLSVDDVQRAVRDARGCVAWNGRLNHSAVDDVINTVPGHFNQTKPLVSRLDLVEKGRGRLDACCDRPAVRTPAKLKTRQEADEIGRLFKSIGSALGLTVAAFSTDGSGPIGHGIGPALELRDVRRVLANDPRAPHDLRDKALFASRILAWDPTVGPGPHAQDRAVALLESGRAMAAFERIIDVQGRRAQPAEPGRFVRPIAAPRSGSVAGINGGIISGVARRAGAPMDKSAGVDLVARKGATIRAGDPLYLIHAGSDADLQIAVAMAEAHTGYSLV